MLAFIRILKLTVLDIDILSWSNLFVIIQTLFIFYLSLAFLLCLLFCFLFLLFFICQLTICLRIYFLVVFLNRKVLIKLKLLQPFLWVNLWRWLLLFIEFLILIKINDFSFIFLMKLMIFKKFYIYISLIIYFVYLKFLWRKISTWKGFIINVGILFTLFIFIT